MGNCGESGKLREKYALRGGFFGDESRPGAWLGKPELVLSSTVEGAGRERRCGLAELAGVTGIGSKK